VELVNQLAPPDGGEAPAKERILPALAKVLAVDPPSVASLKPCDTPGFLALARALSHVFRDLDRGAMDAAASRLNDLLSKHPAHPHLAKEQGQWRLHHHPMDVALVPMWTSICAEAVARMLGTGHGKRFGACEAPDCGRIFFDVSKNASRRFCSLSCQNRVKAAAFRRRQSRPASPRARARRSGDSVRGRRKA
jgi:predicted RNA-binding Zn ribbon-like protein